MKRLFPVLLLVAGVAWLAAPMAAAELTAGSAVALCESAATDGEPIPLTGGPPVEPCNQVVCGPGFFCCNFSCSICAPDGGFCTQQVCEQREESAVHPLDPRGAAVSQDVLLEPIEPEPETCGLVICPKGTTCCNPLCSACTPPGVSCTLGDCGHGPTS